MKLSVLVLVLALGGPLPYVEAAPTIEEDAVVETTKGARRVSTLDRPKVSFLQTSAPALTPPPAAAVPVLLRPAPDFDPALVCPRPPPAL